MSNKSMLWKCFRLFVIMMLTLGNVLSLPAAVWAQDDPETEPTPVVPVEDEDVSPVGETEEAPPVVEAPETVQGEAPETGKLFVEEDEPVEAQATTVTFTGGELLGRPTDTSITINVVPASTIVLFYEYGTASGVYTNSTSEVTATGGQPCEVVISGLTPNTKYYYRMQYHIPAESDWVVRDEHSFWTQRASDNTFVFTVTSDPHGSAFPQAATNIVNDHPDFHVDIGDTFYAGGSTTQSAVNTKYLTHRGSSYFGAIGLSTPIFISAGNHEDEEGWNLDDTPFSVGVANIQARKAYFPTPIQDGFYTGNTDPLAAIDEATYGDEYREDYYAWEWGDALFVVIDPFQYTMNLPYNPAAGEGSDDPVTGDQWSWTLGKTQYDWFKQTLENSDAKYKFVFSHQMLGGIPNLTVSGVGPGYVRGGAGAAPYFEWGGKNSDGSWGFDTQRPGWGTPIHQLMVANGVSAYFHGHDHQYVYEKLDGVVYQEVPSPTMSGSGFSGIYSTSNSYTLAMYPNAGHLRITVTPDVATVDYVRSDITAVSYSYTILPAGEDTTSPTVTIEQAAGQADPSGASTINFTATFSEPVLDFATGDVTLGGTAGATTAVVTGSGTTYNVAVSGMTVSGTVIASIAAGAAHDAAGNPNTASTSADNTVTYDESVATGVVTLDGSASNAIGAANAASVSFSHTTGTGVNRLLLVGASWNCGSTTRTISSVTFTYGSNTLNLSQKVLQETASTAQRFAAIWYSPTEPPQNTSGTVTVTFSGAVTNGIVAGAANFAGVDLTTPFTSSGGANSSSTGTTQSVTLSSLNGNELVFDTVFIGASTPPDPTVGAGQTKLWSSTTSNTRGVASIEQAAGSSVQMSWTTGSTTVAWASAAVAIKPAAAGTTYDLTMAVSPSGGGTTSPAVGTHAYAEGMVVNINATPAAGYEFDGWTGDVANPASASTTVTMNGDKTVTANFTASSTPITFTGTELLGRPEDDSIAISVIPDANILLHYQYGTTSGAYTNTTSNVSAVGGQPQVVTINGLTANTKYYYRMQYSTNGGATWISRPEKTFHTQRAEGSTFSFVITSDAHIDIMLGNGTTWTNTLNDITADNADFAIDLGDTVAMDDGNTSVTVGDTASAEQKYKNVLPYFNIISGSTPVYLLPGNHEQQEAWHLLSPLSGSLPVMSKNAEKKFFLNPIPGSFYSGDTGTYSYLSGDQMRQAYYAWAWGDALFVVINPFWFTTTKPYTTTVGGGETDTTGSGDRWDWTLGLEQFNWLKTTLENSDAKYKFILSHQIVGGNSLSSPDQVNYGHGGVDSANLVEWGGYNVGGTTWGWDTKRAGWGSQPIHQMMVSKNVTAFFHGHDHQYGYEKLDGIVYQAVPSASFSTNFGIYTDGGNGGKTIEAMNGTGHLKITVGPSQATSEFIMTGASSSAYTYTMQPASTEYDLTVAVEPSGAGTTIPGAGTHTYGEGDIVNVSAAPASGYVFDHWSGACSGSGTCQVTMTGDKSVTAHFNLIPVLAPIGNQTANVSTLLTFTASGTDTDPLSYSLEDGASGHVPAGASIGATSGIFTWTPSATGGFTFDVCVSDGKVSDCETITVTVTGSAIYTISGNAGIASATLTYTGGSTTAGLDGAYSIVVAAGWSGTVTPSLSGYKFTPANRTYSNVLANATGQDYTAEVSVPPDLPSSFYGVIHISDNPPAVGDAVDILVEGISGTLISTNILDDEGNLAYRVNVPADAAGTPTKDGGVEGDEVVFKIDGRIVAKGTWHSGDNARLDFHPPQAIAGGPYSGTAGTAVNFSGSANDAGSDASLYSWDWNNDGTYDETGQTPNHTWSSDGIFTVTLKVTDAQGGEGTTSTTVTISQPTATVTLENLNQTYDGSPKAVTVTTNPSGLSYSLTYNGSTTAPTDAGSYAVVATITQPGYTGGNSGTLVIAKAASVTTVTGGSFTYDGAAHAATVTVTGVGGLSLTPAPVYAGTCSAAPVTVAEGTACTASYSYAGDANHEASSDSKTVVINKRAASVTPNAAGKEYGGSEPTLTGVLNGFVAGDSISAVYAREAGETVAGSPYTISAVLSPAGVLGNYNITYNTAQFTISKKAASVTPNAASKAYNTADPVLTGVLSGFLGADGVTAEYSREAGETVAGSPYTISAVLSPAGVLGNYNITYNTAQFTINKAVATVNLSNLNQVYDGSPKPVTVTTMPSGLSVTVTYNGLGTAPSAPGSYAVEVVVNDANYSGTASGTLVIAALHSVALGEGWNLVSFLVKPDNTAIANVLASVAGNYDLVYAWDAAGNDWLKHDNVPLSPDDLTTLNEKQGFWIHMTAADTLEVTGTLPTTTDIGLSSGWNLVGYPKASSGALPGILSSNGVDEAGLLVYAYHAADTADPWKLYDRAGLPFGNDLSSLTPGWGYWIEVTAAHTWSVPY